MPKQAKKKWRKNINLDDLYEGIQQTRQELASGGIVREKADSELFLIDETGAAPGETEVSLNSESPKKRRRKPLNVDEILGTTETKVSIPSRIPKTSHRQVLVKQPKTEEKNTYDVWTPAEQPALPDDLPPPAVLPYAKKVPAQPPTSIRSTKHLLRNPESKDPVAVAEGGQSYNPAFEEWKSLVDTSAEKEQERLAKIAQLEWVPEPQDVEISDIEEEDEEDEEPKESFLGKPVAAIRKTKTQRNKQVRRQEQERLRKMAEVLKSKRKQISNISTLLAKISKPKESVERRKRVKDLPTAPLEVQLSDELTESLRLLKPEGNLFRDRYRSLVERGIVEPRFAPNRKGPRYALRHVEKYDYKHWGKYYGK